MSLESESHAGEHAVLEMIDDFTRLSFALSFRPEFKIEAIGEHPNSDAGFKLALPICKQVGVFASMPIVTRARDLGAVVMAW